MSRMYPTVGELERMALNPRIDRPVLMCEYAHSMGNSTGGLNDYWTVIRSHEGLLGGHIWDWAEQGLVKKDTCQRTYWAYGGDFEPAGEHHDAAFCCNGIVNPDRTLKPAALECKYVFQPIGFTADDLAAGRVVVPLTPGPGTSLRKSSSDCLSTRLPRINPPQAGRPSRRTGSASC